MKKVAIGKILLIVAVLGVLHFGCFDEFVGEQYGNETPGVWLSSGPPEGSLNNYFIHMYWGGWDPDGEIKSYQFAITDNPPEGLLINDNLYEAFEDPSVGDFVYLGWEEIENRPSEYPARTSIWQGRVAVHKPDPANGRMEPYLCRANGEAFGPGQTIRPEFMPAKKVWNGITMYGRVISPNDSSFIFSADFPADTTSDEWIAEFRRTHTFFVRAVDEDGGVTPSKQVAYRSFTARTLSPTADIRVPSLTSPGNPALVPPITTFKWVAKDYIDNLLKTQDPDSVRWILMPFLPEGFDATVAHIQTVDRSEWTSVSRKWPTGWIPYNAPDDSGKFAISPTMEIGGNYVFAVQAKDEAGAVTPVFDEAHNVRRILASQRSTGPSLTVSNRFIGNVAGSSISTPIVIFDLPEGIPLEFCWRASAQHYGGIVSGYRYGWDIVDLNNDDDWETDYTPFIGSEACSPERTFYFGTHSFHVEVIDNSGFKSRVGIRINIVPFSMDKDLLFVDDFQNSEDGITQTKGALPNDEEHDAFWSYMLENVQGFEPSQDILNVDRGSNLPITILAKYKSIIWDVYGYHSFPAADTPTLLYRLIKFNAPREGSTGGKVEPNLLSLYLAAGGHVLIIGSQPMSMSINRSYFSGGALFPLIVLYESTGDQDGSYREGPIGETSFTYNEACIDVLDISYSSKAYRREFCAVNKRFAATDGMRFVKQADTRDYNGYTFPDDIGFNPAVSHSGFYYETNGYATEVYNPIYFASCDTALVTYRNHPRDCFEPIFRQQTASASSIVNNGIVAFWTSSFANVVPKQGITARSAIWGFEPYYFERDKMKQALEVILFGEWQLSPNF